ncbi:MAG: hypothetical protein O2960_24070 [Verrucomicrobia bacterium]|nr:hypothetical protein [Verrucomicrobiota bacterium]
MRTPRLYKICDGLTEAVIYFMVVFSPWAFGTTQDWSLWTMNVCGYVLGALLITKWMVRWKTEFRPERWGDGGERVESSGARVEGEDGLTVGQSDGRTAKLG